MKKEQQPSTAKEIELPRGTMAEVARRLDIPYSTALQGWEYERPHVVEMVKKVVQEFVAAENAVKGDIKEIKQLTQQV